MNDKKRKCGRFLYTKRAFNPGGDLNALFKGNGRNVHVQTKGVYVWYVIYFTLLLYHEIIDKATFHINFNIFVTFKFFSTFFELYRYNILHQQIKRKTARSLRIACRFDFIYLTISFLALLSALQIRDMLLQLVQQMSYQHPLFSILQLDNLMILLLKTH